MPRQSDLYFTFVPTACKTAFEVIEFHLEEALSEPFRLEVDLASANPAVNFTDVLDKPALFTLHQNGRAVRHVHGLVSSFEQLDTGFRRTRYRAIVEPTLARAGLRSDWRIFQQQSVPKIIEQILKKQRITHYEMIVTEEHLPREYCVQAGETDERFLARLAAEEGFFYAFEHNEQEHKLIYCDRSYVYLALEGEPVQYNPAPGGDSPQPAIRRLSYREQVRTAQQTQRDYTFKHPRYTLQHDSSGQDLNHQHSDYERYEYPGRYKFDEAGRPFTQTRLLALRRDSRLALIEGDDARLTPGVEFKLTGHARDDHNRAWRPIRMIHHGVQHTSQQEESADGERGTSYRYSAELIPGNREWKAPLPQKPRVDGPHMATVVGPPGEEIYCDEYGRVKVQFPWDRWGSHNEYSSCWIRVAQNWAGGAWGHIAIPRVGQEVIVDYLDGDPDQPIIIGRTYNAVKRPPYPLPLHKTRMTIKSQSHKAIGFNELRFEDEGGEEEIYVHAQKDQNIHVNNNESTFVGRDRTERVERDETITIGRDRKETVANDETVTIGKDRRHDIGQDDFLTIVRNHTILTGKDRTEEVENNRRDKTAANHWIEIGGYKEESIQGHYRLEAGERIEGRTQRYELKTGMSAKITGPGGSITIDDSGITLDAVSIRLKGPVFQSADGSGNPFSINGAPAPDKPLDRLCGRRPDGTCLLEDCSCLKGAAK